MDNFRDSYFQVDWDLTTKRLKGTYWGKQYDTGRGFAVTVINGGQVVAPTTEVLRLKWEKPDNTTGYVNATIVNGKFIVENIDQMFTVHGSVRADFELSVGGEFVASITFYVNVEKAVAVDAIESSSDFTALQVAIATADSIDAQLAQKANDAEVRKKSVKLTLDDLSQSVKESMTGGSVAVVGEGAVTTPTLGDKVVTPRKLSGSRTVSDNLINKDDLTYGGYITANGGTVVNQPSSSGLDCYTPFIEILPNTSYYKNNESQVCIYNENKEFFDNSAVGLNSFSTSSTARYIRASFKSIESDYFVSTQNKYSKYQFTIENLFVPFEDHSITTGKNKFDGRFDEDIIVGIAPSDVNVSSSGTTKSAVIPLERGKTYTIKKYAGGDRLRFSIVSKYPNKDVLPLPSLYHLVVDNSGEEYTLTLDNTYGEKPMNYLVIYTNSSAEEETPLIQVEEGTEPTDYEDYEFRYLGKPLKLSGEVDVSGLKTNYFLLDDIQGIYNAPELQSVAPSQSFNLDTSLHTDIYSLYDDIMTENANYITKSLLGNATLDKPIYQYNFTPQIPDSDVDIVRPKIVLTSGVHGNEKSSVWGLVQFLKDMCENWKEDPILEFFRWNYEFVVVPMVNPSGYDLNQRKNANNVDLNRNFPVPTWINGPSDPDHINYRGPSPASEVETQIMVNFLDENLNAVFVIDFHNFFQHNDYLVWLPYVYRNENKNLGINLISTLSRKWKKQYDYFPQDDNQMLGFVNTANGASLKYYGNEVGIKTCTLETVHQVRYGSNNELYDKTTITCAVDVIGNMLTAIAKSF